MEPSGPKRIRWFVRRFVDADLDAPGHAVIAQRPKVQLSKAPRPSARRPFLAATNRTPVMPHALLNNVALLAAGDGKFNPLDPNGAGNLIWTLLIFLLALPFMWKMVFGPISAALLERDSKANEAVNAAQAASEQAERSRAEVEVALGNANAEAKKIVAAATARAETRERDIVENAKKEAEAMITSARTSIEAERDKAVATIRGEVVDLSLKAATEVLGRKVDGEDDKRLAESIINASGAGQ